MILLNGTKLLSCPKLFSILEFISFKSIGNGKKTITKIKIIENNVIPYPIKLNALFFASMKLSIPIL